MNRTSWRLALCALIVSAAVLGGARPAATAGLAPTPAGAGGLVFLGATGSVSPPLTAIGGTGVYTFSGSCAAGATFVVGLCTISASGTYSSFVCGSGMTGGGAFGAETDEALVVGQFGLTQTETTIWYGITFVNDIGILTGTFATLGNNGITPIASGSVAGEVEFVPSEGNCVTGVTQLTIEGNLTFV